MAVYFYWMIFFVTPILGQTSLNNKDKWKIPVGGDFWHDFIWV